MEDVPRKGFDDVRLDDVDFGEPLTRVNAEDNSRGSVSPTKRSYEQFHEFELSGGNTPRRRLSNLVDRTASVKLSLRRRKQGRVWCE